MYGNRVEKMRKVIVSEFVTLDGVMEAPDKWSFPYWNEEIGRYKYDELFGSDVLLLGRVTYEQFAGTWPGMKDEDMIRTVKEAGAQVAEQRPAMQSGSFAERMNGIKKYVASRTLKELAWNNSELLGDDVAGAINKLKHTRGRTLLVNGSCNLIETLAKNDIVDEYRLLVYPIVVKSGKRLFDVIPAKSLKLAKVKKFGSGVVLLVYRPAKNTA